MNPELASFLGATPTENLETLSRFSRELRSSAQHIAATVIIPVQLLTPADQMAIREFMVQAKRFFGLRTVMRDLSMIIRGDLTEVQVLELNLLLAKINLDSADMLLAVHWFTEIEKAWKVV